MRTLWAMLKDTVNKWFEDKAQRLGAALAYYAAFSIAPLLVLMVAIAGFFYEEDTLLRVQSQIAAMTGVSAAEAIIATLRGINETSGGFVPTVLSFLTLIIGATGMFGQLQDAMNTIWGVTPKPRAFWSDLLRSRLLSFSMVLAICFLLLVSLALSAFLANASAYFKELLPFTSTVWPVIDFAVSFAVTAMLFAAIFRILPDVEISWNDVWLGAAATAALFALGKIAIGLYLGRSAFTSAYGAAGSMLVMLAWVYYSSQILFFGAEFTWVYATHYGHRIRPARGAVLLTDEMRIRQGIPHVETIQKAYKDRKSA
jgi:membrane protein